MKTISKTFFALGTVNTIQISYHEEEEDLAIWAAEEIQRKTLALDDKLSVFKEDSEISRINALSGRGLTEVSSDTAHILKEAAELSAASDNSFDITTEALTQLWHKGTVPKSDDIAKAKALIGSEDIIVKKISTPDGITHKAGLRRRGQFIGLGSIAKGYAADQAKKVLQCCGIYSATINFGGTIIIPDHYRRIGIQWPWRKTGEYIGSILVRNAAIVTSGSYENRFIENGKSYHHIIDPTTGCPSESGLLSVTLVGGSATELDAFTTAVFVLGLEKGSALMHKRGLEGVFITNEGEVLISRGIKDSYKPSETAQKYITNKISRNTDRDALRETMNGRLK